MPISPETNEKAALLVRRLYEDAETEITKTITRLIAVDLDTLSVRDRNIAIKERMWVQNKYADIVRLRKEVERQITRLRVEGGEMVTQAVEDAYRTGSDEAIRDLRVFNHAMRDKAAIITEFGATNTRAVEAFVNVAVSNLNATHLRILRAAEDGYRSIIADTVGQVLTGTRTRQQAAQDALNAFANKGISGYQDKAGRNWDLASYAEMATRSASGQAAVQGHIDRLAANGRDLVIVSDSPEECELCRPWEGKVLSINGSTQGRPTVQDARDAGLWHPNCSHSLGAYIEGLTEPMRDTANPEGYEDRQQQRYNERQIRHWKRREAVAITKDSKDLALSKVREWNGRMEEFLDETDRTRKRQREQITEAR